MSLTARIATSIPAETYQAVFYGGASIGGLMALAAFQKIREARRNEQLRDRAK